MTTVFFSYGHLSKTRVSYFSSLKCANLAEMACVLSVSNRNIACHGAELKCLEFLGSSLQYYLEGGGVFRRWGLGGRREQLDIIATSGSSLCFLLLDPLSYDGLHDTFPTRGTLHHDMRALHGTFPTMEPLHHDMRAPWHIPHHGVTPPCFSAAMDYNPSRKRESK